MATIDRFVIEASVNSSNVSRGLQQIVRQVTAVQARIERIQRARALNPLPGLAGGAVTNAGNDQIKLAQKVASQLNTIFARAALKNRAAFAEKSIDAEEFQRQGAVAAYKFNLGLQSLKRDLRKQFGALDPNVERAIDAQYKRLGSVASAAFKGKLLLGPAAGGRGGFQAEKELRALTETFRNNINSNKMDLARNKISSADFHRLGIEAANAFDTGLADTIDNLKGRGIIGSRVEAALYEKFKNAGAKSSRAFYDQFQRDQAALRSLGDNFTQTGNLLTRSVTLPVVAMGTAIGVSAASFEKGMNAVRANASATDTEFLKLVETARSLGQSEFGAKTISEGMVELARAGFKANQVTAVMPGIMALASAGQLDLAQSAKIATNVLRSQNFDPTVESMNRVADVLTKVSVMAQTDVNDLAVAFKYVGAIGASAGLEFETITAALGGLSQAGFTASFAGTALRGSIAKLADPTAKGGKILEDMGIKILDTNGKMLHFSGIVRQLEERGISFDKILRLLGQRAGPGMASLLAVGSDALLKYEVAAKNAQGEAQRIREIQLTGAAGEVLRLRAAFQELSISIGQSGFLGIITNVAQGLIKFATVVANLNPNILLFAGSLAGAAALAGPLLIVVGALIKGFVSYRGALFAARVAQDALAVRMLALSGWITGGIVVALGLAVFALYQYGKASRKAWEDTERFRISLAGLSREQLNDTAAKLIEEKRQLEKELGTLPKTHEIKTTFVKGGGLVDLTETTVAPTKAAQPILDAMARIDTKLKEIQKVREENKSVYEDELKVAKEMAELQERIRKYEDAAAKFQYDSGRTGKTPDTPGEAFAKNVQEQLSTLNSLKKLKMSTWGTELQILKLQKQGNAALKDGNLSVAERLHYLEALASLVEDIDKKTAKVTQRSFEDRARDLARILNVNVNNANGAVGDTVSLIDNLIGQIKAAMIGDSLMGANVEVQADLARALSVAQDALNDAIRDIDTGIPAPDLEPSHAQQFATKSANALYQSFRNLEDRAFGLRDSWTSLQRINDEVSLAFYTRLIGVLEAVPTPAEAFIGALDGMTAVMGIMANGVRTVVSSLYSAAGPIGFFSRVFEGIANALAPSMERLAPVFEKMGNIVNNALAPILDSLVPILEQLFPIIQAIMNILTPIIRALIPLFAAMVPILEAFFPVLKAAAIAFTYVAQVIFKIASIILKVVAFFVGGIGSILVAIGKLLNKLPGSIGNPLISAGRSLQSNADAMKATATALNTSSDAMEKAREDIRNVDLATTLADTANAAKKATENLLNIPEGYKVLLALRRFEATTPVNTGGTPTRGYAPALPASPGSITPPPVGGSAPGGTSRGAAPSVTLQINGGVNITADDRNPKEMVDDFLDELQSRANRLYGDSTKWSQVQE